MSSVLKVDQIQSDTGTVNISSNVVFSSGLTSGSAAAPSIFPAGDTNTGIFFPAADTIAFAEGGAERMRIDSSGHLGIGTSSPGTNLEVKASSGSASMRVTTSGGLGGELTANAGDGSFQVFNKDNYALTFGTNNTERARISAAGVFSTTSGATIGGITVSPYVWGGSFVFSGGGTQTVLTLGAGEAYLFYSGYVSYGAGDHRHGVYTVAGRTDQTAAITQILRLGNSGGFSLSGNDVQYTAGGGNPYTTIFFIRLS